MAITGLKLRTSLARCDTIKVTVPSGGYVGGQMIAQGDLVVVVVPPLDTFGGGTTAPEIAEGLLCGAIVRAPKILLPCEAAATGEYAIGTPVYFDSANSQLTGTASGSALCGYVIEAPAVGATEILVAFDGALDLG